LNDTNVETQRAAKRITTIIDEFRKLNPEMQAQQIVTFLTIAAKPLLTVSELGQSVGQSTSAVSRNVAALGKTHRGGKPGLDLVIYEDDVADRRLKRIRLNPQGLRIMATLEALI
jgi:DNA-binding MarR family transcriptional regulator